MPNRSARPAAPTTSWTVVRSASEADDTARTLFVARYEPLLRSYLAGRWRIASDAPCIDDALQDVFVECFKHGGALERVAPGGEGGFRAYLLGVARNVARVAERQRATSPLDDADLRPDPRSPRPSVCLDRAFATAVVTDAMEEFRRTSRTAVERLQFEVVRLRFADELPPRTIAARLGGLTPRQVSKLIEKGLCRYQSCLLAVLRRHAPTASSRQLGRTCRSLLQIL